MAKYALLLTVLIVTGCTTVSNQPQAPNAAGAERALADENFLVISGNYQRLITLYKEQLKQNNQPETRVKLAKAYLDTGDNESALFTLVPVVTMVEATAEVFYLQGLAQFNLGQAERAERSLAIAVHKEPNNAKIINLLGAAQAELGQLVKARASFDQARTLLYDDNVIKNNLALVDMMEGKYQDAAARLMPLYRADPENTDAQLKANLAIVAAKLGSFETLRALYGSDYNESELFGIFQGLRASAYVPSISVDHSKSNKLIGKADASGDISWKKDQTVEPKPPLESVVSTPVKDNATPSQQSVSPYTVYPDTRSIASQHYEQTMPNSEANHLSNVDPIDDQTLQRAEGTDVLTADNPSISVVPQTNAENRQTFEDLVGISRRYSGAQPAKAGNLSSEPQSTDRPPTELNVDVSEESQTLPKATPKVDVQWPMPASSWKPASPQANAKSLTPSEKVAIVPELPELMLSGGNNSESIKTKKNWHFVALEQYSLVSNDGLAIPVAQFRHSGQLIDIQQENQSKWPLINEGVSNDVYP